MDAGLSGGLALQGSHPPSGCGMGEEVADVKV